MEIEKVKKFYLYEQRGKFKWRKFINFNYHKKARKFK